MSLKGTHEILKAHLEQGADAPSDEVSVRLKVEDHTKAARWKVLSIFLLAACLALSVALIWSAKAADRERTAYERRVAALEQTISEMEKETAPEQSGGFDLDAYILGKQEWQKQKDSGQTDQPFEDWWAEHQGGEK